MRALVQRVTQASVVVRGGQPRAIGPGLVILLGVRKGDAPAAAAKLAAKCAGLRIFDDAQGKLNLSCLEVGGSALVVSQFTLYANTQKGRRPSFIQAAGPPDGVDCYEEFVRCLRGTGLADVQTGTFGAEMQVHLTNDGPVTLLLDTDEWQKGGRE